MQAGSISHEWSEETPEGKARWFQSLTLQERMSLLCEFTDLILSVNPGVVELRDAEQAKGRVLVLAAK